MRQVDVRPTANFISVSGQIDLVRSGKPFLLFGNGALTACKPISDDDLGEFVTTCVDDASLHDRLVRGGASSERCDHAVFWVRCADRAGASTGLPSRSPIAVLSVAAGPPMRLPSDECRCSLSGNGETPTPLGKTS